MGIIPTHVTADEPIIGAVATVLVPDFPTVGDQATVERTLKRTMTFKKQFYPFHHAFMINSLQLLSGAWVTARDTSTGTKPHRLIRSHSYGRPTARINSESCAAADASSRADQMRGILYWTHQVRTRTSFNEAVRFEIKLFGFQ